MSSELPRLVGVAPGSMMVRATPNGAISRATVSQNPSMPHLEAW
ncbi:hypothetical protein [Pseudonocardia sp.]